jgi:putative FmdB family regulatory protein
MPTYEYQCSQCGKTFDYFQAITDQPLRNCPDETCGGRGTVRRLIGGGAGLIFKGSGFYATDYKKSGNGCPLEKKDGDGKSDSADKKAEAAACCPHAQEGTCPAAAD